MRTSITIALLMLTQIAFAQIKGNRVIETRNFPVEGLTNLAVNLYAKIEIDCEGPSTMEITADQNLFEYIDTEMVEGKIGLNQKEWIQPSQAIKIKIGAPALKRLEQGTHETTIVNNLNREKFQAMALVGTIRLNGKVESLNASGEVGTVDAKDLEIEEANVNLWSWGTIELANPARIEGTVKESGSVIYSGNPTTKIKLQQEGSLRNRDNTSPEPLAKTRYIDFKLKNNSSNRIDAYVKGPKPDGKYFSYGFPMRSGQIRKERWTIGTKVYRTTALGTKKLLIEIKEGDEGETVNLYPGK